MPRLGCTIRAFNTTPILLQSTLAAHPRRPLGDGADNSQPSARVLQLWRSAQAVCFDVDW